MRSYIRHPTNVPIELSPADYVTDEDLCVHNVSIGGLSLKSGIKLKLQTLIKIKIPLVEPPFETVGQVVWCRGSSGDYEVGVQFIDEQDAFAVRMVEQVCHIEHYRMEVRLNEGRSLSPEEAAREWIDKYAGEFPSISSSSDRAIN